MFRRCYFFSTDSVQVFHFTQSKARVLMIMACMVMCDFTSIFTAIFYLCEIPSYILQTSYVLNAHWNLSFHFCLKVYPPVSVSHFPHFNILIYWHNTQLFPNYLLERIIPYESRHFLFHSLDCVSSAQKSGLSKYLLKNEKIMLIDAVILPIKWFLWFSAFPSLVLTVIVPLQLPLKW